MLKKLTNKVVLIEILEKYLIGVNVNIHRVISSILNSTSLVVLFRSGYLDHLKLE